MRALLPHYREMQRKERASNKWSQSPQTVTVSFVWSKVLADMKKERKDIIVSGRHLQEKG